MASRTAAVTLVACLFLLYAVPPVTADGPPIEQSLLLEIKKGLSQAPTYPDFSTWIPKSPCSKWEGLTCNTQGSVVSFVIGGDSGTDYPYPDFFRLPPAIGQLTHLQHLEMDNLQFYGPIPSTFKQLRSLQYLSLLNTDLEGTVEVLSELINLKVLHLDGNRFDPSRPTVFTRLTQLQNLTWIGNEAANAEYAPQPLPDPLPTSLIYMDLSGSFFGGPIPASYKRLKRLQYLSLGSNAINGTIPATIGDMEELTHLDLSYNLLQGQIPDTIGNAKSIQELIISNNALTGRIPSSIGSLTRVSILDFSVNSFVGPLPSLITRLPFLHLL